MLLIRKIESGDTDDVRMSRDMTSGISAGMVTVL